MILDPDDLSKDCSALDRRINPNRLTILLAIIVVIFLLSTRFFMTNSKTNIRFASAELIVVWRSYREPPADGSTAHEYRISGSRIAELIRLIDQFDETKMDDKIAMSGTIHARWDQQEHYQLTILEDISHGNTIGN